MNNDECNHIGPRLLTEETGWMRVSRTKEQFAPIGMCINCGFKYYHLEDDSENETRLFVLKEGEEDDLEVYTYDFDANELIKKELTNVIESH